VFEISRLESDVVVTVQAASSKLEHAWFFTYNAELND